MLEELIGFAHREGLVVEPGCIAKRVNWLAALDTTGKRFVVRRVGGRLGKEFRRCPDLRQSELTSMPKSMRRLGHVINQAAHFLVETCAVVALLPASDGDEKKVLARHSTFLLLLSLAGEQIDELKLVHAVLSSKRTVQRLKEQLQILGAKSNEKISFEVQGNCILDGDAWLGWWQEFRRSVFPIPRTRQMICFATGLPVLASKTHPKVTKLGKEALTFGAPLISFDKESFGSYGLLQGENAAVSEDAAWAYRAALDTLLARCMRFGELKVTRWYKQPLSNSPDPIESGGVNNTAYVLAMIGAKGRMRVRFWQSCDLTELGRAICRWFDDLEMVHACGDGLAVVPSLEEVLSSQQRLYGRKQEIGKARPSQSLQLAMLQSVFNPQTVIPVSFVVQVLGFVRAALLDGEFQQAVGFDTVRRAQNPARDRLHIWMGLLRAAQVRHGRRETTPDLNQNHSSRAYHCGRLAHVLLTVRGVVDQDADEKNNRHRSVGLMMIRPAEIIETLSNNHQRWIRRIEAEKPGFALSLESQLQNIWERIETSPSVFSVDEQSLFVLGYFQQLVFEQRKLIIQEVEPNALWAAASASAIDTGGV
jgi:CRISPR-associated protein Csd1